MTSLVVHQARFDLKVFFRDPRARGLTLGMPLLLLLLFGYIFRHDMEKVNGHAITGPAYYVPRMIVLGIVSATLSSLVISIVARRESGAFKRRRATPARPSTLIAGDVITSETSALVIAIVVTVLGWALFSVHLDAAGFGAALVAVMVGAAALSALAYAISTMLNSVDSAQPVVMLVMFALLTLSGIYIPESLFPVWLRDVAQVLPIRPLALAMQAAFDPVANGGSQFAFGYLLIVLGWGAAGAAYAARRFSWSPKQS